jgi:mono/diheme cytochrome c family protein
VGLAVEGMMGLRGRLAAAWEFLFGDGARAFGTLSVVLVLCLAVVPAKDQFREWRQYQHGYLRLISHRGDAQTLQRRFQGGLQQIWLPDLGVVDRCDTCHVAMKEASLADVSTQPFRPHPVIPHSLTEFGCVMCHRGQGAATSVEEAHSSTKAWEEPMLPARYLEASCGQCHQNALTGTPQLNLGRTLLTRYGCVGCHTLKTPEGATLAATDEPPPLTHIAEKTSREWVYAWLKNPQAYSATATMPDFKLTDADARDISAFVMAQSSPYQHGAAGTSGAKADAANAQEGASVYGESFCASCHAVQNAAGLMVGGDIGPELTRIGSKVKPEWMAEWLRNPKSYAPHTAMPRYRFTEKQLGLLAGFLEAKTDSDLLANVHLELATKEQIAHGKALVNERGCASCHELNGIKKPENFAPELSAVGSRSLAKLVFAPGVEHTLADYLAAKIRQPRIFGNQLKMPQYSFSPSQLDALVTALLAQTERASTLQAALRVRGRPVSHYEPAGKAGKLMEDMQCFSCHAINGRGGDMAPDLTWEGSSVQRTWLVTFLKNPNTLRPALIRRMPRFNVTDAEAQTLTDYIMTAYQTPAFDADSLDAANFSAADRERGRQLFYSKYACQSCHIVDPQNDKGYVGPTLTQVGARLTAAWIFHYLKDPQALRPQSIEPNQHMTDDDARALVAFLMVQKKGSAVEAAKK